MASINGIEIKNLKTFRGHEGEPLYQGTIYKNGAKLGFWSQDAHGGICDNFEFNEILLQKEVYMMKDFLSTLNAPYLDMYDASSLMADIATLKYIEGEFKRAIKSYGHGVLASWGWSSVACAATVACSPAEAKSNPYYPTEVLKSAKGPYFDASNNALMVTKYINKPSDLDYTLGSEKNAMALIKKAKEKREAERRKAEAERRKEEEKEKKINASTRFMAIENGKDPSMIITDTKSGKSSVVPLFAYKEVKRVLFELFE